MAEYWKDYCYVDAHYEDVKQGVKMKWVRIPYRDVPRRIVAKANGHDAFTSIQRYRDAVSLSDAKRAVDEMDASEREAEAAKLPDQQTHYHGIYFDFDYDAAKNGVSRAQAISVSQGEAQQVARWFIQEFDINPAHVQCWFTGNKGFHIVIRPEVFSIRPHMHLSYIVKSVAIEVMEAFKLRTLDKSVYTISRQWRIPNTVNNKSGFYKIELTVDELMNFSSEQIIAMSKGPRQDINGENPVAVSHIWEDDEYKNISPSKEASAWWDERYQQYDAYRDMLRLKPVRSIQIPEFAGQPPVCVQDLMNGGTKPGANRNQTLMSLAAFYRDAGYDQDEANLRLKEWTERFYGHESSRLRDRINNARSVVYQAFQGRLMFTCRYIRACGGEGVAGRVACVGESSCEWIQDPKDQEPAELPVIELSEASKGCYINTKIRTSVHVAAVAGRPYGLPVKGKIECTPDPEAKICFRCPNNLDGGQGEIGFSFTADDREVLNLVGVNDNQKKGTIRASVGIPAKCFSNRIRTEEYSNLEEIQITPTVSNKRTHDKPFDHEGEGQTGSKEHQHVVEAAYYMGHGMRANKKYVIDATVMVHPKDQRVSFLFDTKYAAQDDIEQFRLSPELHKKLRVFQVREGQTIHEKLTEIHQDFTANVHQIGGRFDLSIAVDLCYHSVIGFKLDNMYVTKGWFELLVIGDTSTGKSTLVQRMMEHFNLGEIIAGENAKRTGLVWASVQMQGQWILQWGKIPQNDRRLLVIDEFSGIPTEEIGKMTQLRSTGVAFGGGVTASHETQARTRLILITNPRDNRGAMEGFNYGVVAVQNLFGDIADVRRVDLAVCADKKEVKTDQLNKRWGLVDMPHTYTSDLCRNLVLWAWSREPHQVDWIGDAEQTVFDYAEKLGDSYECDIPLAERGDLKLKIARISAAVAARLFSTDADAKRLFITKAHVDYAAGFMDQLYRKSSMSYFEYAKKFQQNNNFTETKRNTVRDELASYGPEDMEIIVSSLLDLEIIGRATLYDMVNIENDSFRQLWRFLHKEHLIQKHSKGYIKTGAFTTLLKSIDIKSSGFGTGPIDVDTFQSGGEFVAPKEDDDIYEDE